MPAGHVFLSHAGADTRAAREFAEILRRNGLEVWFDKDNLLPGENWQAGLEVAIAEASAMVVYVGRSSIQSWVDREVRFGLVRNTRDREGFRFIPVLGEGAEIGKLPPFVQQQQCVDLRDAEQVRRLIEVLRSRTLSQAAIPAEYWTTHTPFRSLRTFGPEDAWLFFGRDHDTDELLSRLGRAPTLAVIGNSGSGKSSLIQAGLIPGLRRGRFRGVDSWRVAVFRPSSDPFGYLAEVLAGQLAPELDATEIAKFIQHCKETLPGDAGALRNGIAALIKPASEGSHVLLVADQFEELFTLVPDPAVRRRYIDLLLAAARLDGPVSVHLVLALRADFYANCLDDPKLSAALDTNLYNVPGMSPAQLRDAIENRLALAGARAEAGLIDSLLADVGAEPGNLALLEHALAQLWDSPRRLTNDAYAGMGRLRGALGKHADEVYRGLGEADRQLAQRIFLELVQLGEGAQDTRRRVGKEALLELGDHEQVGRVIAHLVSKRLVATSGAGPQSPEENFVEVSHEALIREWPALQEWLKDNREDLRLGRILMQAAEEWRGLKRDASALIHGVPLARGKEWLVRRGDAPVLLREFLKASDKAEMEAAAKALRAERLSAVRSRRFAYAMSVLVLIAVGAALFARWQQLTAQSRALVAQAEQILSRDQPAALNFAIRGWQAARTAEAELAVARAFPQLLVKLEGAGHAEFSPDGQRIVTARSDGTAWVWNSANGQILAKLVGHTDSVARATFSPDGQHIVTASWDHTARVWNSANGQLLATMRGHTKTVIQALFSPDGQHIVTASGDNTARVWNAATGQLLAKLEGHTHEVNDAAFSPDGQRIVTASDDKSARVWNVANGQLLATLGGHTSSVREATFSPDGQRIVTASDDETARVWDATSCQLIATLKGHTASVARATFSPDGQRIVTASEDETGRVWNAANGQLLATLEGHTDRVLDAAFSPDGQRIVTASEDQTARVWNLANGQLLATLEGHTDRVREATFSPDGHRVITTSRDNTTRVWIVASGQLLSKLERRTNDVLRSDFSLDGKRVVTANVDRVVRVWNLANGQLLAKLEGHADRVFYVAFSPQGQHIVTVSYDNTARVWNASSGKMLVKLVGPPNGLLRSEFSPDGERIVTASRDGTARVWNAANGQLLAKLEGHTGGVVRASFSPDGHGIVTASEDHTARVWNAASGQLLAKFEGHTDRVLDAAFSPDGQRIVTASDDHTARVWTAANGQLLATLEGHTNTVIHATFSPDSYRIVTASRDKTARLWKSNGQLLAKLEGHLTGVYATFSPDGQRIVTASDDHTARVWNAANGQLLAKLEGHTGGLVHAAFSPDGQRILTASYDGTVRVYRIVTLADIADLLQK